ncbi:MAG: DUF4382 domain-containing protein [Nitrospirae bacterium]|nr:DUF4382 domain-containing protein [Candidatus Manganitrophaceae bacterium]
MFDMPLRFRLLLCLLVLSLLTVSCNGGGGTSGSAADPGTGRAAILLTDRYEEKITDHQGQVITSAKEIWVTFSKLSLKPEEGDWMTLFDGPKNKSVDLLSLHGKTDLVALADLPPGRYDKARLQIEEAWFIDSDGTRHDVIVPSHRVTIQFKHDLVIHAGDDTEILFDFVPGKSIHLIETGSGKFILRPVVRVRLKGEEEVTEVVKVEGKISSIDCDAHTLTLARGQGDPITVHLEEALFILKGGAFHLEDDDHNEAEKEAAQVASCKQLQEGETVEILGTADDQGVLHASLVRFEEEAEVTHRIEFAGTLLKVGCDSQTVRVTFSGGEIDVSLGVTTKVFTDDDKEIAAEERCDALKKALQKQIGVEGTVEANQVIATEITLPAAAPTVRPTRLEGIVQSITVNGTAATGFILKDASGKSYTVTTGNQTEIKDQNGNTLAVNQLLNHQVRVEGPLDTQTLPNPTIAATLVRVLS